MQRVAISFVFTLLLLSVGCAGFSDYRREQQRSRRKPSHSQDGNWKTGYGFNNPNPERIRNGLEPMNFDGSLESERESQDSFVSQYVGDMIGYGLTSGFSAIARSLTRR